MKQMTAAEELEADLRAGQWAAWPCVKALMKDRNSNHICQAAKDRYLFVVQNHSYNLKKLQEEYDHEYPNE